MCIHVSLWVYISRCMGAHGGHWLSGSWSDRQLWVIQHEYWKLNSGSLQEQPALLPTGACSSPWDGIFYKDSWKSPGFYYIAMGLVFFSPWSLLLSWRLVLWRCLPDFPGCPLCTLCHYAYWVLPILVICISGISNYLEIALAVPCHQVQPFLCLLLCPIDT